MGSDRQSGRLDPRADGNTRKSRKTTRPPLPVPVMPIGKEPRGPEPMVRPPPPPRSRHTPPGPGRDPPTSPRPGWAGLVSYLGKVWSWAQRFRAAARAAVLGPGVPWPDDAGVQSSRSSRAVLSPASSCLSDGGEAPEQAAHTKLQRPTGRPLNWVFPGQGRRRASYRSPHKAVTAVSQGAESLAHLLHPTSHLHPLPGHPDPFLPSETALSYRLGPGNLSLCIRPGVWRRIAAFPR